MIFKGIRGAEDEACLPWFSQWEETSGTEFPASPSAQPKAVRACYSHPRSGHLEEADGAQECRHTSQHHVRKSPLRSLRGAAVGPSGSRVQHWMWWPLLPLPLQKFAIHIHPHCPQDSLLSICLSVCLSVCLLLSRLLSWKGEPARVFRMLCFKRQWAEVARKERARGEVWFDVLGCWQDDSYNMRPLRSSVKSQPSTAPPPPTTLAELELWSPAKEHCWCSPGKQSEGKRQRPGEGWFFYWKNYLLENKELYDMCGEKSTQEGPGFALQGQFLKPEGLFVARKACRFQLKGLWQVFGRAWWWRAVSQGSGCQVGNEGSRSWGGGFTVLRLSLLRQEGDPAERGAACFPASQGHAPSIAPTLGFVWHTLCLATLSLPPAS